MGINLDFTGGGMRVGISLDFPLGGGMKVGIQLDFIEGAMRVGIHLEVG